MPGTAAGRPLRGRPGPPVPGRTRRAGPGVDGAAAPQAPVTTPKPVDYAKAVRSPGPGEPGWGSAGLPRRRRSTHRPAAANTLPTRVRRLRAEREGCSEAPGPAHGGSRGEGRSSPARREGAVLPNAWGLPRRPLPAPAGALVILRAPPAPPARAGRAPLACSRPPARPLARACPRLCAHAPPAHGGVPLSPARVTRAARGRSAPTPAARGEAPQRGEGRSATRRV
jgi:hypothetical protein